VRTKRRQVRVASFSEPRDRARSQTASPVLLAPDKGRLVDQYRHLAPTAAARRQQAPEPEAPAANPVAPL
jgi:hypothetical protein